MEYMMSNAFFIECQNSL